MKFLKIEKKRNCDEYIVYGKGGAIGQLAVGDMFKKRIGLWPDCYTKWTSECLRQVADKLEELEATKPPTAQND